MLRHSRYLVACCGAVCALAAFAIGLEVSSTTAAPSTGQNSAIFNRTLKGDRLPLSPATTRNAVNRPVGTTTPPAAASRPELPDGCEPVVSAIGQPPLARVPGRCIS
jgi:hypothetical protein